MLGQVIVNNQNVLPLMHKIFSHGSPGIGCYVLKGRCLTGRGRHDNGIIHGIVLLKGGNQLCHGGCFLANGHIDADHILALLVQYGIHGNGGLTGLPVSND